MSTARKSKSARTTSALSLRLVSTRTSYAIEVPKNRAHALFNMDQPGKAVSLLVRLEKIDGIAEVNYDSHFGPFVYVTIDVEQDTPKTHAAICRVIQSCLDKLPGATA